MSRLHRGARPLNPDRQASAIEPLESRMLLSGIALSQVSAPALTQSAIVAQPSPAVVTSIPITIHPVVGIAFSGDVGKLSGLSPTQLSLLSATVRWGDGSGSTPAQLFFGASGILHVQGQHTYAKTGSFPVTVSVIQSPPPGTLIASRIYTINSTADVTQNSVGGATIHPSVNQSFSGVVGSFTFPQALAPVANPLPSGYLLVASINWGDGQSSIGKLVATGANTCNIRGVHTYSATRTFRITILVTARPQVSANPIPAVALPQFVVVVADILSTAVVGALVPTV